MKAITKKPFDGVKDGEIYPSKFVAGNELTGDLAKAAVAQGWAAWETEGETKTAPRKAKAAS